MQGTHSDMGLSLCNLSSEVVVLELQVKEMEKKDILAQIKTGSSRLSKSRYFF